MGWFSREKTFAEQLSDSFLDAFPAWAIQHSTELAAGLHEHAQGDAESIWKELLSERESKSALIDFFTGAHGVFLMLNPEGQIIMQLVGQKTIENCVASWPQRAKDFFVIAATYHQQSVQTVKKSDLLESLEKFYGIEIRPLDAHIATVATDQMQKGHEGTLFPSLAVAGLLPTLNRLQEEQVEWLKSQIEKWKPTSQGAGR